MTEPLPSTEKLATNAEVQQLKRWAMRGKRALLPHQKEALLAALKELDRHRKLEHDRFWGEADD